MLFQQPIHDSQLPIAPPGQAIVVRDHEQCFVSVAREIEQQINDRVAGLGIEVACRFVRKNNVGIIRESARNRHSLLLAAG